MWTNLLLPLKVCNIDAEHITDKQLDSSECFLNIPLFKETRMF